MSNRRYEQGGVVSFVIIAIILAALLGAGIWWAKKVQTPTATRPNSTGSSSTSTLKNSHFNILQNHT